ncbi:uncharacterized protein LOC116286533 [Actinia tenebrosa]|uniref:Uncharacterized protein LOC116286533 n=1 Tax=Actinia tenebrosa TaxID=6105 RepID=A0A6P8H927_ACTTE|nr:uncharacterized protein LOC116286533 [Actinia tenebrosa]
MAEKLLTKFAKENFGHTEYIPAVHGRCSSIKPSTLIIKRKRAWWKKPFHHSEMIVLSELEKYVDENFKKFYTEVAESLLTKSEKKLKKKEIAEVVEKHSVSLKTLDYAKIECETNCNMGDMELGNIDEIYYEDTDLRSLLENAILSNKKLSPYSKQKMYIVTGVVYSSMFKVIGKRETSFGINGQIAFKSKLGGWMTRVGSLRGGCSNIKCKAALVSRTKKAPILFTISPVEYDEQAKKLKLPNDVFVGNIIARGKCSLGKLEDKIHELAHVTEEETEEQEQLLSELFQIAKIEAKIEAIERLLMSVNTRDEREVLVVKFLYMLERLLSEKGQKLYLDGCYFPETDSEKDFFTELGLCLDGANVSAPEEDLLQNVQDYGLILKFIAASNQEELDELDKILIEGKRDDKEVAETQEQLKKQQAEEQEIVC